ncbi:MAG: hypothetical protein KAV40_01595, partial [Thermoplasmatales archaeon]|nr:hypothetical protein [Thermoplasmatales archaeon]
MKYSKITKIGAVVIAIIFLGSMIVLPMSGAVNIKINKNTILKQVDKNRNQYDTIELPPTENVGIPQRYDTIYIPEEDVSLAGLQNDIGYNCDAGNNIVKSFLAFIGEPVDQSKPGSGREGTLDPSADDDEDWYMFSVCEGQSMQASVSSGFEFGFSDHEGASVGQSHTATETGRHFIHIFTTAGAGDYTLSI